MSSNKKYQPSHLAPSSKETRPKRERTIEETPVKEKTVREKPVKEKPVKEKAERKKEKVKSDKRRISPAVWIVPLVIIAIMLISYLLFAHYYSKMNITKSESWKSILTGEDTEVIDADDLPGEVDWDYTVADVTNILLIGVDNNYYDGMQDRGNADGLMILSINKSTKQVVLSSLMRDVLAYVPSEGYKTKLTLSYHYAGTQALIDTIEYNFGIPIDNYVMVNYLAVIDIVDAVGGLELDVTADEIYWMESKIKDLNMLMGVDGDANILSTSQAGTLTLNGIQTAAFLRIRYAGDGDFDRTGRARTVLMAIASKVKEMKKTEIVSLADRMLPQVTTDLSQIDTLSLLANVTKYLKYDMVSNRIPIDDSWEYQTISGGSYVVINYEKNRAFLYSSIYEGSSN